MEVEEILLQGDSSYFVEDFINSKRHVGFKFNLIPSATVIVAMNSNSNSPSSIFPSSLSSSSF